MSQIQLNYQANGELQELKTHIESAISEQDDEEDVFQDMGVAEDISARLDQAQQLIRNCTQYTLESFKQFGAGQIEEVTIKFGIQFGGKAGIPYITEGNAKGNIDIEVKCKF
ncbi:MAG: hypothetical protein F6K03_11005 [Kamptonema sp. SIO4C4]|nr:hypothetical protein [Kamptonema sp. SIO4C4]